MTTPRNYTFYKFVCINDDVKSCYVGSTANIKKRRTHHKSDCHNENGPNYNFKIYKTIRENGGWKNWKIVEFATRDNITKREAEQVEEQYRVELKGNLNTQRAFRTVDQWKADKKEWRENNPEYHKGYYENNKQKISEQKKEYYVDNKEKLSNQMKEYREANKEQISAQKNEKHNCPCGGRYTHSNKAIHFKSQKHQKYLSDFTTEADLNP